MDQSHWINFFSCMEDFFRVILADASNQFIVNLQIMCVWAFNILHKIHTRHLFGHITMLLICNQIQMSTTVFDLEKFSRSFFVCLLFFMHDILWYSFKWFLLLSSIWNLIERMLGEMLISIQIKIMEWLHKWVRKD